MLDRGATAQPVGQMPHRDDIAVGGVIPLDHAKIGENHERRTLRPGGQQDRCEIGPVHPTPVDIPDTHGSPDGGVFGDVSRRQFIVEPPGQNHFDPPGLPRHPPIARQIGGGRGQRICRIIPPDIPPPIAGEIHGKGLVRCRHELRMPHRARPTAAHLVGRRIPVLQNLEPCDQLGFKKPRPPPVIGQRRHRLNQVDVAAKGAIGRFQPPDRRHDMPVDAIPRLDGVKQGGIIGQRRLSIADAVVGHGGGQIIPQGLGELVLVAVLVHHACIVMHPGKGRVKGRGRDPCGHGPGPKSADPSGQSRIVLDLHFILRIWGLGHGKKRKSQCQCYSEDPAHQCPQFFCS